MAISFDKHKEALISAWKDVLDEKSETNWALFGYDGQSNDLKFVCKGDGGLTELLDDFNSGKIMYAFLKVDVPDNSISKYVLINWQGEGAPTVRKGTCANHIKQVTQFFSGFHLTMHARTEDDLEEKVILDKLAKAGSAFNFKSAARGEELPQSGPVGTAYRKVNPVQEINSKERDQFWIKEEQEEKKRVELERKRREEEKKKAEEDTRRRDELEAAKRATAEDLKSPPTPTDASPTLLSASETVRRQRSAEAKQLIGHSTQHARAMFEQNLAQGQMANRRGSSGGVPDKPVRSSVVASRISALTSNTGNIANSGNTNDTGNTNNTSLSSAAPQEELKTSPLKNIDKIALSLQSPSQIQYEPINPTDLSPNSEHSPSFSAVHYPGTEPEPVHCPGMEPEQSIEPEPESARKETYREVNPEPMIKQNILENDMFDASYSSGNENDDDDSDNKFSTIKRSPYSKSNIAEEGKTELSRQNTVIENVNYNNGNGTAADDGSPEAQDEGVIYEDLDEDPGLTARALYDYQAADESEITFDPDDVITHIEQIDAGWWQGLGPHGAFGLFPANYVQLLPAVPR